ncbi:MAG: glycosyltransferase family 2 protein [Bacteroidaceae bacterium]|nr:glycosyltransferase family 2 protein [Bacteroidaceae bacterium]
MNLPLVSVLIPLYNEEKLIAETIRRCLQQSYTNIEIIVVDDHSTDQSYHIAKSFEGERVHVFKNPKKGVSSARNYAFIQAHGDYIKYLDADDFFTPELIEKQVARVLEEDGAGSTVAYCTLQIYNPPIPPKTVPVYLTGDYQHAMDYVIDALKTKTYNNIQPPVFLFPREVIVKANGWNEEHSISEDVEFVVKALSFSQKVKFVSDEYAVWRILNDGQHLHENVNVDNQKSDLDIHFGIAKTVLDYRDDEQTREICSNYLSYRIFNRFEAYYPIINIIQRKFDDMGLKWLKYENHHFGVLYRVLGWKRTTKLILDIKKLFKKN